MRTSRRGFTLIELMVVVAIIGLLSSVVIGSLNSARLKAADANVRAQAIQLRNVMELEMNNTGSYTAIKAGGDRPDGEWYWAGDTCSGFTGSFAAQAAAVCSALVAATGEVCSEGCVYFAITNPDAVDRYSIIAYLPYASQQAGDARLLCLGSSGRISIADPNNSFTEPGCTSNP